MLGLACVLESSQDAVRASQIFLEDQACPQGPPEPGGFTLGLVAGRREAPSNSEEDSPGLSIRSPLIARANENAQDVASWQQGLPPAFPVGAGVGLFGERAVHVRAEPSTEDSA